jgi:stearoyl-CoA desaturase (delta-9 desaturase)
MQNDILEWCRDHRVHHKYSETSADPHNAKRGFFFAHIGWLMMKKHPDIIIKGRNIDISDLKRDPVVMFHHRHYALLSLVFSVLLPILIPCYFWNENLVTAYIFLVVFRLMTTLHSTWLVNSAAHLWGSRNYDKNINPSDNRFVSFAAIGEGWHNYHHTFPYDYGASEWGPRINLSTIIIDLLAAVGMVYDRKQVSQQAIERVRKRVGDLSS